MLCEKAAIPDNLAKTARYIHEAQAQGVDIIAFPETSLTGYVNPTQHPEAVLRLDGPEVAQVCALTEKNSLTALVGILEENPGGKPFPTRRARGTLGGDLSQNDARRRRRRRVGKLARCGR